MDSTDVSTATNAAAARAVQEDCVTAEAVDQQQTEDPEAAQQAAIVQQRLQDLSIEDAVGPSVEEGDEPESIPQPVSHADLVPELIDVEAVRAENASGMPAGGAVEDRAADSGQVSEFASVALAAVAANHLVGAEAAVEANESEGIAQQPEWTEPQMEDLSSSDESEEKPPGPVPIAIPWKQRSNQVFALTNAGKSIYSRYGDENEMLGKMGVIQAIISRCECDTEERIRHITAGGRSFVFLLKEPIYLLIISTSSVPIQFLRRQLEYVYRQITFVLTTKVYDHLTTHANYDVRSMLGPQDHKLLECMMQSFVSLPHTLFNAFSFLPLDETIRQKTTFTIQRAHVEHALYGIVLAGDEVVTYCQLKNPKHRLRVTDLLLLQNFGRFAASSNSLNASVSWMPVCLPGFNASGFLQALVCFIAPGICLIYVTTDRSEKQFHVLSGAREWIEDELTKSGCIAEIQLQLAQRSSSGRGRISGGSKSSRSSSDAQSALSTPELALKPLRVPGLIHFVYRSLAVPQCYFSPFSKPFDGVAARQQIWENYQNLVHDFYYPADPCAPGAVSPHWQMAKTGSSFVAFAFRGSNFELYAHFDPLVSVSSGAQHCNAIIGWISQHTKNIFVPTPPIWPVKV